MSKTDVAADEDVAPAADEEDTSVNNEPELEKARATNELFQLGIGNEPMRMVADSYVGIVGMARRYNRGDPTDPASVQYELDAMFGAGYIDAADILVSGALAADFTVAYNADDPMALDVTYDGSGFGLPDGCVRFTFSDGFVAFSSGPDPVTHAFADQGEVSVQCDVLVAEKVWTTSQATVIPEGWTPPVEPETAESAPPSDDDDESTAPKSRRRSGK